MVDLLEQLQLEDLPENAAMLAELVGMPTFRKIVRMYNGDEIYIPGEDRLTKKLRDEYIRSNYNGCNGRELARMFGLTYGYARRLLYRKHDDIPGQGHIEGE